MIRPITPDDTAALLAIAEAIGFQATELEYLSQILSDYLGGNSDSDPFWVTDDDEEPVGVAYCAPEPMTSRTWNLLWLAVRPDRQGQGRGTALMRYVEQRLTDRSQRLLLVETSGGASFERTRAFYRQCGYSEEARIRDFYQAGDDKLVYRKVLTSQEP